MVIVKRIGLLSLAKITTLFGILHGIVMGLFWGFFIEMLGFAARRPGIAGLVGLGLFVVLIIAGAVIGFIAGIVWAFLYNIFAGWTGGVEIEVH